MRWADGRRSRNVEDRRGARIGRRGIAGGGIGAIVIALLAIYFGVDPGVVLQEPATVSVTEPAPGAVPGDGRPDPMADFVSVVLADTEDTWNALFRSVGRAYREPKLVLFSGAVESACGFAQAAMGPFYCPSDQKVYLDLAFFRELRDRFGAPGDFAQAYVIAHEIGHHVQTLLGISQQVSDLRRRVDSRQGNQLSVLQELQADCLAGVWAHHADQARHIIEEGDVEEAIAAAAAVGDDRIQRRSQGYVVPDAFTHGSSRQRAAWFARGIQSGDLAACDTFSADAF